MTQSSLRFLFVIVCTAMIQPCGQAAAAQPTSDAGPQANSRQGPVVVLEPYAVLGEAPKLSFGVSLEIWKVGSTNQVSAIYLGKLKPGSDAQLAGLGPRTRIDRIDGKPVEEFAATLSKGSELNRVFINRKLGDKVVLEVLPEGQTKTRIVTLTEKPWMEVQVVARPSR
jgi:hypothetical protein